MSLSPGTRLGPYEIQTAIGAGGMGEVYRARDTRLDRTVAIKVLPPDVSGDPARRARFEREAKTIAGLDHPHICTLHDVGEYEGSTFLVMEHLDGQTLAERLRKGPLPLDRALEYGAQIADALSKAHHQGVVHRDVKPANVMVTKVGVKLLDFGIAKLTGHGEQPAVSYAGSSVPMQGTTLTANGVILGTQQYMAPEQLEGRTPDARTDVWALGAVLYEMVTGKRAFEGDTAVNVMSAIMDREPPSIATLQPLTPPLLDRLVRQCLAKSADDRPDSAHDVARELRWISDQARSETTVARAAIGSPHRRRWGVAVAGVLVLTLGAVAGVLFWRTPPPPPRPAARSMRLAIALPADKPLAPAGLVSSQRDCLALALSHDGTRLAYAAVLSDRTQICLRDMRTGEVTPVEQTAGAHTPFFSPDDEWLGFFADHKLKKVPLRGGAAVTLADAPNSSGATWGTDGKVYFNRFEGEGVFRVDEAGGPVESIVSSALMPGFVGAGPGLLVSDGAELRYVHLAKPADWRVIAGAARGQHLAGGIVIYGARGVLMASRLDPSHGLETSSVKLSEGVRYAPYGVEQFAASDSGTVVWSEGRPQGLASFVWVDRTGRAEPAGLPEGQYGPFALSPDGTRLCYELDRQLYIGTVRGGSRSG